MGTGLDIYRLVEEYVEGIINHEDFETLRNYAKASSAQRDEVRRIMDILMLRTGYRLVLIFRLVSRTKTTQHFPVMIMESSM